MTTQVWNGSEFVEMPAAPYTASGVGTLTEGAPEDLDTLAEIAAELSEHAHSGTYVPLAEIDAKGDLLVGSAADTLNNLGVGTDGHVLTADSAETLGVKWAAAAGGAGSIEMWRQKSGGRYYYPPNFGTLTTAAFNANQIMYVPFVVGSSVTFNKIGLEVTTFAASAVAELGVYADDGNGWPAARIVNAGSVSTATNGVKEATISWSPTPDLYWLAVATSGGNAQFRMIPGDSWLLGFTGHRTSSLASYFESGTTLPTTATPNATFGNALRMRIHLVTA